MTPAQGTTPVASPLPGVGSPDGPAGPTGPAPLAPISDALAQLMDDPSVPRNIRRGAQAARDELVKPRVALDVRVASAVNVLDELANDPNIPTHGRTAIWSIISSLESLQ